ncbi:MAG: hypothetical protein Fues2KO_22790 [Fuerstiella sp.]
MSESEMRTKRFGAASVLMLIVVVAAALRMQTIAARPIWFDEAFSWTLVSEFELPEIVARTAQDVHPPLYYLLLWLWTSVFGDSLFAMRSLSALLGTAVVALAWLVGRQLGSVSRAFDTDGIATDHSDDSTETPPDRSPLSAGSHSTLTGFAAASLVASSAFQIHWSGEIRMYALLSLLLLVATHYAWKLTQPSPQKREWAAFSFACAAMMYTHNYGLFSVVGVCAFVLLERTLQHRQQRSNQSGQQLKNAFVSIAMAGLLYLPWFPTLLAQRAQVADDYWIQPFSWRSVALAWDHLVLIENRYGPDQAVRGAIVAIGVALLIAALQIRGRRADRLCLWLTVTPVALAVAISLRGSSIISERLFVLAHLAALLAMARAIGRWLDLSTGTLLTVLLIGNGLFVHFRYQAQLNLAEHQGVRAAIEVVESDKTSDRPVIVLQPCIYFSVRYHATDRDRIRLYTSPENIRHYTGQPILQQDEFQPLQQLHDLAADSIWILTSTGFSLGYSEPFVPAEWKRLASQSFDAPYAFEGQVQLLKYVRTTASVESDPDMRDAKQIFVPEQTLTTVDATNPSFADSERSTLP